jgi:predicted Zn-dependent peptidase
MSARISRLDNGIMVVSQAMPGIETAAVSLSVDAGSRNEAAAENGLAHLFEHMVFKGTARRSAREIAEEIEDVGGALNAWTSRDSTLFHARTLAADLALGLDLIADLVVAPRFDAEDLDREKQVVLSEIGEAADLPEDLVFDHLQAAAFPDQPLGRPVLGTVATLATLDEAALRRWRAQQYRGGSLVVAAAGRVDHDRLVEDSRRLLGGLPPGQRPAAGPAAWQGGAVLDRQHGEQAHVALAWNGPGLLDPGYFAAQVFAMALGGGMSSRLFQEVREERGLAYTIGSSHSGYTDTGMLAVHFASQPADAGQALDLVRAVADAAATGLEPAEVARARAQLKAGLLMGLEGPAGVADWLARCWATHGRLLQVDELVAAIDAVDADRARAAGAAMLASVAALAAVGPGVDLLGR